MTNIVKFMAAVAEEEAVWERARTLPIRAVRRRHQRSWRPRRPVLTRPSSMSMVGVGEPGGCVVVLVMWCS